MRSEDRVRDVVFGVAMPACFATTPQRGSFPVSFIPYRDTAVSDVIFQTRTVVS